MVLFTGIKLISFSEKLYSVLCTQDTLEDEIVSQYGLTFFSWSLVVVDSVSFQKQHVTDSLTLFKKMCCNCL